MNRDCNWYQHGQLSSTGACCDIGATVRQALERYLDGGPAFGGGTDPRSAGNGSLMRLAPVAMYDAQCPDQLADRADDSSRTTHAAAEALDACRLFAVQLRAALLGGTRDQVLHAQPETSLTPAVHALAIRDHVAVPAAQICGMAMSSIRCRQRCGVSPPPRAVPRPCCVPPTWATMRTPPQRSAGSSPARFTASTASRPPGANACRMRQRLLCWQTGCTRRRQWPDAAATIQRTGTYAARCR